MKPNETKKNCVKWIPNVGENYFFADWEPSSRQFETCQETLGVEDLLVFDFPIFKNAEDCDKYCDRLNKVLMNVEP